MIKTDKVLVVEGRYDKNKLKQIFDAVILKTDGFAIFKDKEKQKLISRLANERGIVIVTDSDSAGFQIRNFLKGMIPNDKIQHVYIPDIYGKERRKSAPGKEGKLGVEGMDEDVLLQAFEKAGITANKSGSAPKRPITKADLFELGLSGRKGSKEKRAALLKRLDLPEKMSPSAMLDILNIFTNIDKLAAEVAQLDKENT